jgi:uncharacterized protein YegP (UPF0339 family)
MAKFTIRKSFSNQYYFRLQATGNNETLITSEMYNTKSACIDGIASVKANAPYDSRYDRLHSSNRQYYFNLKSSNGQVIGTSETYISLTNRDAGIELVKAQAPSASTEDLS